MLLNALLMVSFSWLIESPLSLINRRHFLQPVPDLPQHLDLVPFILRLLARQVPVHAIDEADVLAIFPRDLPMCFVDDFGWVLILLPHEGAVDLSAPHLLHELRDFERSIAAAVGRIAHDVLTFFLEGGLEIALGEQDRIADVLEIVSTQI